ncbi:MAG TPA: hypothetical protein VN809_16435 [Telmatospirillum sp.]|nr:hypothetical protein [Telmatospirillum sp.]
MMTSVFHEIANAQARGGDFDGALQTIREIKDDTDRFMAMDELVFEQAYAGDIVHAAASLQQAMQGGVLKPADGAYLWETIATTELLTGQKGVALLSAEKAASAAGRSQRPIRRFKGNCTTDVHRVCRSYEGLPLENVLFVYVAAGDSQQAERAAARLTAAYQTDYRKVLSADKARALDELRDSVVSSCPNAQTLRDRLSTVEERWGGIKRDLDQEKIFTDLNGEISAIAGSGNPEKILK